MLLLLLLLLLVMVVHCCLLCGFEENHGLAAAAADASSSACPSTFRLRFFSNVVNFLPVFLARQDCQGSAIVNTGLHHRSATALVIPTVWQHPSNQAHFAMCAAPRSQATGPVVAAGLLAAPASAVGDAAKNGTRSGAFVAA
jgi:hypothetical protein